jgi:hypothetical protein
VAVAGMLVRLTRNEKAGGRPLEDQLADTAGEWQDAQTTLTMPVIPAAA